MVSEGRLNLDDEKANCEKGKECVEVSRMTAQHETVDMDTSVTNANCEIGELFVVEVVFVDGSRGWRHVRKQ